MTRFWSAILLTATVVLGQSFISLSVHAAAAVQRRVQMQQEAQQAQQMAYQQAVAQATAQKQAQEMAMYQQAMVQQQTVAQQQAYQQAAYQKAAAEYVAYRQAMQQAMAQKQAQEAVMYQQAVAQKQAAQYAAARQVAQGQQVVAYKNAVQTAQYRQAAESQAVAQEVARAQMNAQLGQYAEYQAKRQAVMQVQAAEIAQVQTARELAQYNEYQKVKTVQNRVAVAQKEKAMYQQYAARRMGEVAVGARLAQDVMNSGKNDPQGEQAPGVAEPETTVNIRDLWRAMDTSSKSWAQIIDRETKILTVAEHIDRFRKAGITIKKTPGFYVDMIDSMSLNDEGMLTAPFMNVLSYAAIVEYDFENGQNKDELARKILGEQNFQANKSRLAGGK